MKFEIFSRKSVLIIKSFLKALLKYVSGNTGLNLKNIIEAEEVFDTLLIERRNNYQLPKWVDDDTYNGLKEISDKTFYFDYMSKTIQRLRAGMLFCSNQNKTIFNLNFIIKNTFRIVNRRNCKTYERSNASL